MTIQPGWINQRAPVDIQSSQPKRPSRKSDHIVKFWAPRTTNHNQKIQDSGSSSFFASKPKAATPQPQRKMVSFWESKTTPPPSPYQQRRTGFGSSLTTTTSRSMTSLVEEKRGFTPSEVIKDPAQKEFLTTLSRRIFSPSAKDNQIKIMAMKSKTPPAQTLMTTTNNQASRMWSSSQTFGGRSRSFRVRRTPSPTQTQTTQHKSWLGLDRHKTNKMYFSPHRSNLLRCRCNNSKHLTSTPPPLAMASHLRKS